MEAKGDIPEPRSGHSATLFGTQIFVFGGYDGSSYHNDLYALDTRMPSHQEWLLCVTVRHLPNSAARPAHLLRARFAETFEWRKLTASGDVPPARAWHTANQVRTKIFIFGGTGAGAYNDLHILDPGVMRCIPQISPPPQDGLIAHPPSLSSSCSPPPAVQVLQADDRRPASRVQRPRLGSGRQ